MKFAGFHEIRNERPIARNGKAHVLFGHMTRQIETEVLNCLGVHFIPLPVIGISLPPGNSIEITCTFVNCLYEIKN